MNTFTESIILNKLENNIEYINNTNTYIETRDRLLSIVLESIDYCNKLNLFDKRKEIIEIIKKSGNDFGIMIELGINKPYLYVDNDSYSNNYYFIGNFKEDIININKKFNYRYQYDLYLRNKLYFESNKEDVDFVIRNYKNILLNTKSDKLKNMCLDRIYEIHNLNIYKELVDGKYIEIIEKENIEDTEDLVSIIVMSYNNDNYIEDTIKSIYEQDYKNIELIIADDCSKNLDIDDFKNMISKYNNTNIKRVILYKNKINLGTVSNCNKALCLSSGKYIKFIASDDLFYDYTSISNMINNLDNSKLDLLMGESEIVDIYLNNIGFTNGYDSIKESLSKDNIINNQKFYNLILEKGPILNIVSTIFNKSTFELCGFFDENYLIVEDWPYAIKLSKSVCKFGYINKVFAKYRKGSGITYRRSKTLHNDYIKIRVNHYNEIIELIT